MCDQTRPRRQPLRTFRPAAAQSTGCIDRRDGLTRTAGAARCTLVLPRRRAASRQRRQRAPWRRVRARGRSPASHPRIALRAAAACALLQMRRADAAHRAAAPPCARAAGAPWQAGLSPELVAAASKTLATVQRCAATLPSAFYTPPTPPPAVDKYSWDTVTEEQGVKARRCSRGARCTWRRRAAPKRPASAPRMRRACHAARRRTRRRAHAAACPAHIACVARCTAAAATRGRRMRSA
jgi:hypothetical protein